MHSNKIICGTELLSSILPYVHVLSSSSSSSYCSQCFNASNDLKRCSKCRIVSYCSVSCQRKDWIYHKHECLHLHEITDEYDLIRLYLRFVLRYEMDHGIDPMSTKRSMKDLEMHKTEISNDKRRHRTFKLLYETFQTWNLFNKLTQENLFELFCRLVINTLTIHDTIDLKPIGYGLYFDATIYDHSCVPTCHTVFNGIYLSIRTISDECINERTINYIDLLGRYEDRQEFLRNNYYFNCQCKRCLQNDKQELILLEKIHHEEQQMDKFISQNDFSNAYQSSKQLFNYYNKIFPYYHAYVSLHHVKQLKLELLLADTMSDLILQLTMKNTCRQVQISMGDNHPLTNEAVKLCEQYKLEIAMKQRQLHE